MSTYNDTSAHSTALIAPDSSRRAHRLTSEQHRTLRAIARARDRDCDEFVRSRFGCVPEELTGAEAAACINMLAELLDA